MTHDPLVQSLRDLLNTAAKKTRYLRWLMLGFWVYAGLIFIIVITAGILIVTGNEESLPYTRTVAGSQEDMLVTILLWGLALLFFTLPLLGHAIVWGDRTLRAAHYLIHDLKERGSSTLLLAITTRSAWFAKDPYALGLHWRMESVGVKTARYDELFAWLTARGLKREYFRALAAGR
jgi:hypothetical protein